MSELVEEIESRMKRYFESRAKNLTETIRKHIIHCAADGDWHTWVMVDDAVWNQVAEAFRKQDMVVSKVDAERYKNIGLEVNMMISWEHLKHRIKEMLRESTVTISKVKK